MSQREKAEEGKMFAWAFSVVVAAGIGAVGGTFAPYAFAFGGDQSYGNRRARDRIMKSDTMSGAKWRALIGAIIGAGGAIAYIVKSEQG